MNTVLNVILTKSRAIAWVTVTDRDTGDSGVVHTTLRNEPDFELIEQEERNNGFMIKGKNYQEKDHLFTFSPVHILNIIFDTYLCSHA